MRRSPTVDAHAHLLPREVWRLPHSARGITEVRGDTYLDDFRLAVTGERLADVDVLLADMDAVGIDVRVVSPPPYAFPVGVPAQVALEYCRDVTESLVLACASAPDRLIPFGTAPSAAVDEATASDGIAAVAAAGAVGVALTPLAGDVPVGEGAGRAALLSAARHGLPVLLHPMQQPAAGLAAHYLRNLLGNPVETAVGVASLLLGGLSGTPGLRVLAVHGGGCVPGVVGRWDHGARVRPETGPALGRSPSRLLRDHEVYADLLTHDPGTVPVTTKAFGPDHVVLGSDYPFDMGCADPVRAAADAGTDVGRASRNALRWLGGVTGPSGPHIPDTRPLEASA